MPLDTDKTTGQDERGRDKLVAPLPLPRNRSTGNLTLPADAASLDPARYRMSCDAPSAAALDHDALTRLASRPFLGLPSAC